MSAPALAAGPDVGLLWGPSDLSVLVVGELASDAGLECVAMSSAGTLGVYALGSGQLLGSFPAQLSSPTAAVTLRDFDNDGLAEMLCLVAGGPNSTRVGLLDMTGDLHRVWPDILTSNSVSAVDFMDLNAGEPQTIVLAARQIVLLSSQSKTILYESDDDPGIGPAWLHDTMLVDDFDSNGNHELLATMRNQSTPNLYRSFLIGDRAAATTSDALSDVGRAVLGQSWPNPASGPTRIEFRLSRDARVRLRVFDAAGRLVRTLEEGPLPAGAHQRLWDGRDERRATAASGIYFYELDVDGKREARKTVQVR
jgi:hypothetical protein